MLTLSERKKLSELHGNVAPIRRTSPRSSPGASPPLTPASLPQPTAGAFYSAQDDGKRLGQMLVGALVFACLVMVVAYAWVYFR